MHRHFITIGVATLALTIYGLWNSPMPSAFATSTTGTLSGKVLFVGDIPQAKTRKIVRDTKACGNKILSEDLVVSPDRGLQNAVVTLVGLKGTPIKAETPPTIDQKGCVFRPRVLIAPVNVAIDILNNDGVLHNFHTYSRLNPRVNKAQPAFRKKMNETFKQPEIIKVTCDAHPWMSAWIVVTDHPYVSATDGSGSFQIGNVPAGNHTVEIWHETLGNITRTVAVKAGEDTKVTIELSAN
jgi:plastocyanin